jgi:hypothetical protein
LIKKSILWDGWRAKSLLFQSRQPAACPIKRPLSGSVDELQGHSDETLLLVNDGNSLYESLDFFAMSEQLCLTAGLSHQATGNQIIEVTTET